MKDAKGHGSAAHQDGIAAATSGFATAKATVGRLDAEMTRLKAISDDLIAKGGGPGPMNLPPEHVRTSQAYRDNAKAMATAFAQLRQVNGYLSKHFTKELKAERDARRAARLAK